MYGNLAFGFGVPSEWAIIFIVALIVFGPKKLPEIGQQIGQALREFRKMADDVTGATDSIRSEVSGATQSFRRQVDEVRQVSMLDQPATPIGNRDLHLPEDSLAETAEKPKGLKISTAAPVPVSDHSDLKG